MTSEPEPPETTNQAPDMVAKELAPEEISATDGDTSPAPVLARTEAATETASSAAELQPAPLPSSSSSSSPPVLEAAQGASCSPSCEPMPAAVEDVLQASSPSAAAASAASAASSASAASETSGSQQDSQLGVHSAESAAGAEAAAGPAVSASSSTNEDHRRRRSFPAKVAFASADGAAGASSAAALRKAAEWTICLDRSTGLKLGMSINKGKLRVENILPNGLVAAWNQEHPDKALQVGCRIVAVNGLTSPDEIFQECSSKRPLDIVVAPPAPLQSRERGSLPSNFQVKEQLTDLKVAREPIPGGSTGSSHRVADGSVETINEVTKMEVNELETLKLGPFEAGVVCEITEAWYGCPGDESKQLDVTDIVRRKWNENNQDGMHLSGFNKLFLKDPAPLRFKRLSVSYRLHNVQAWDVSRAKYTEGVSKLGLVLPIVTKALSNVVGATVAASGYAAGKVETSIKRAFIDDNRSVADSEMFQWGFTTWMALNGILPSVTYEDTGASGVRLRRLHNPDEDPPSPYAPQDMKQTPILVSNHVCYIDGFILPAIFGAPKVLAKAGCTHIPLIDTFAQEIGVIEVDRENSHSRAASKEAIQTHVDSWKPGQRSLLLFPEGTCSNGDGLLPFKKGAFMPAAPVRPVVIYYTGNWHPANVNFKMTARGEIEPTGDAEWMEQFLGHMVHSMQVKVLPPYIPDGDEVRDPQIYADNVSKLMTEAYKELKAECEQRKEDAERNSWQALARRSLIDTPVEVASGLASNANSLASRLWQGTVGVFVEDGADESPDRRAANRSSERRKSKKDSDGRKHRKHEKHDND